MAKILIIDDVEVARNTMKRMLERKGHTILEAENGKKGIKIVEQEDLNLVITDIIMPDMEGIETIRKLVKMKPGLPIIAVTASTDSPYLQMALKFGAVCGLFKPFKQAELLNVVEKALNHK